MELLKAIKTKNHINRIKSKNYMIFLKQYNILLWSERPQQLSIERCFFGIVKCTHNKILANKFISKNSFRYKIRQGCIRTKFLQHNIRIFDRELDKGNKIVHIKKGEVK